MKSFTDLEQSKKLSEILPLESADMYYAGHQSIINPKDWEYGDTPKIRGKYISFDDKRIFYPCWSLAALMDSLPNNEHISTTVSRGGWSIEPIDYMPNTWWCEYEDNEDYAEFSTSADNQIDACYEMIIRLNELKML